jgi:hypothetical protein
MELGWSALALLCLAAAAGWFWHDSLRARENANAAAMDACGRLGLQFLDGTVAFARLSPTREMGRLQLRRTYVFDYTANSIERRQGFVILTGARVESVGYAPGEEQRRTVARAGALAAPQFSIQPPAHPSPSATDAAKASRELAPVFDLEQWRARRSEPRTDASTQAQGGPDREDRRG